MLSCRKDSCFAISECIKLGHELIAVAHLHPVDTDKDELDSFMYQTVGHNVVRAIAECLNVPLYSTAITGGSKCVSMNYDVTQNDEVEDLLRLLQQVRSSHPDIAAVCSGAIMSNYQRVRVENVCSRLQLVSLAPLWYNNDRGMT
jgi:diphthine-ammonia ligase